MRKIPFPGLMIAGSDKGVALILTLVVVAILTAMVTEFTYSVYMDTNYLENWETSRRLSLAAKSGASIAGKLISENTSMQSFTYPGVLNLPFENLFEGSDEKIFLSIEDENSKFNINTLVYPNNILNADAFDSFKRLLRHLALDEHTADMVVDWIDRDGEPRLKGSEEGAKNAPLDSPDEMLLIAGIKPETYDKLRPYITVWGSGLININGADMPVLATLSDSIDEEMAKRVVEFRKITPFENESKLTRVAGFETLGISLLGRITVKATAFRIISDASLDKIKRTLECVLTPSGEIRYWKET